MADSAIEALPQSFTLQIIDSEGEVQGDWICVLDPDTPCTYWSECGEYRVVYDEDSSSDGDQQWLYLGGMFHDRFLAAPGGPERLPRSGWVGVEGGPGEGYTGKLSVGGSAEAAAAEAAGGRNGGGSGDVSWFLGGADSSELAPEGVPAARPLLPPAEAPCGNWCQLRQARCCVGMDTRPLAKVGEGYVAYVDGEGYTNTATRHEGYCPTCRERIEASARKRVAKSTAKADPSGHNELEVDLEQEEADQSEYEYVYVYECPGAQTR